MYRSIIKRVVTTLVAVVCVLSLYASGGRGFDLSYRGFSGGMMLHTGYANCGTITIGGTEQKMAGMPSGIGGALRVRFGEHLRVGTEGYVSSLGYGDFGSSLSIVWGGLLVDWAWKMGKFTPYAGVTIGGGSVENLTLTTEPEVDMLPEIGTSYRNYAVGVVVPFVGVEYPLTERMSLTVKGDYMLPLGTRSVDFPSGIRGYVGFMFNH